MAPWNLGDSNGKNMEMKWQVMLDEDFKKAGPCLGVRVVKVVLFWEDSSSCK